MKLEEHRIEQDLLGDLAVPAQALFGIQTQRAIELYPLNGEKPLSAYPELLAGLLQVKKLVALTNIKTCEIDPEIGLSIINAVDKMLEDLPLEQFPVHSFHGGGGISSNMNVNEVLANIANFDSFGTPLGSYTPVNPYDHVNLNNSTSDALNTACHLAVIDKWQGLSRNITALAQTFDEQGKRWKSIMKIARTCLQDAVEISFSDLFSGYSTLLKSSNYRLDTDVSELYRVNLGGNIIGRSGDCSAAFFEAVISELKLLRQDDRFSHSDNLFAASQNHDDLIRIASGLDQLARALLRIAKDFRLMASGPDTGLCEIRLPAVQPGSSAMPGKVNPTIPEFLIQCSMQACGRCHSIQMTQDHGELDYTPWQSIVISNLLDTMSVLESGVNAFRQHCVTDVEPNIERNAYNINTLIPTLIRLKKKRGYSFTSWAYKHTGGDLEQIRRYLDE